ncbi:hypothetical protein SCHPADRAFT_472101 [Schizopora paradoxa]|uniref:Uncharacterized protein n=1 Tax=Schizopora paradoxa TaxID=27342 RepID=A0A0H2RHQ2_9AGAM|nr:hypothetical protein SCHPADRAFT_472101 [Schizopora paradoxa]
MKVYGLTPSMREWTFPNHSARRFFIQARPASRKEEWVRYSGSRLLWKSLWEKKMNPGTQRALCVPCPCFPSNGATPLSKKSHPLLLLNVLETLVDLFFDQPRIRHDIITHIGGAFRIQHPWVCFLLEYYRVDLYHRTFSILARMIVDSTTSNEATCARLSSCFNPPLLLVNVSGSQATPYCMISARYCVVSVA